MEKKTVKAYQSSIVQRVAKKTDDIGKGDGNMTNMNGREPVQVTVPLFCERGT